jgi:hypothetical protein
MSFTKGEGESFNRIAKNVFVNTSANDGRIANAKQFRSWAENASIVGTRNVCPPWNFIM